MGTLHFILDEQNLLIENHGGGCLNVCACVENEERDIQIRGTVGRSNLNFRAITYIFNPPRKDLSEGQSDE